MSRAMSATEIGCKAFHTDNNTEADCMAAPDGLQLTTNQLQDSALIVLHGIMNWVRRATDQYGGGGGG